MAALSVQGTVAPGFEPVYQVFEESLRNAELGAAACAYFGGAKVVDLWGGWADADRTDPWARDTLACTFSAIKGLTATCAHLLVDRGLLDVDEPIATYWPEFAQAGKGDITMRMVLSHQSGLPYAVDVPRGKKLDWPAVSAALAAQAPVWEPGTRVEYHGGTFGYLVGNVIQRIDGRPLATFFHDEVATPMGADFLFGLGQEHDDRCAVMVGTKSAVGPCGTRQWRLAADGSATGFGTAEGLARVYAGLCGAGDQLVADATIDAAIEEQDLVRAPGPADEWGLGYQLFWKLFPGMNTKTFGHFGMGGSVGLADRKWGLSCGVVVNKLGNGGAAGVINATYGVLVAQYGTGGPT
jgi:CubicO group peptidase (beta-lactamase class C family)